MAAKAPPFVTVGQRLALAEDHAAAHGADIDRLYLNPVERGVPGIDVHERVVAARAVLTIEGASTLTVSIHDPDWLLEGSELLAIGSNGRMHATDVALDTLAFRLVKATRQDPSVVELTFEDLVVALLREHNTKRSWRRGTVTRAEALRAMVGEVQALAIPFYSPERGRKQLIAPAVYPSTKPARAETGFDKKATFKIKGNKADSQQMIEVATALGVADQLNAGPRARLAMLVAGIGESNFAAVVNSIGYGGVFQGDVSHQYHYFKVNDTEQEAHYFLKGGKGFQAGGAIALARAEPSISPGAIATRVEASGKPASFYDAYRKEADAIDSLWNKAQGADASNVSYAKTYQFTRGLAGAKETSWEAGTRWATEVQWRLYAAGGVVVFASDDFLITTPADIVLDDPLGDGMLERPTYDWDHGKQVGQVQLKVKADRWSVVPGSVAALLGDKWGPVKGRWIVQEVDQNLLDPTDTLVTLTKPVPALLEPATEIGTRSGGAPTAGIKKGKFTTTGGARGIVEQAAALVASYGTYIASAYRPGSTTTSGSVSDHSENNADRAARDIAVRGIDAIVGPPSPQLDKAAVAIGNAFGRSYELGAMIDADTFMWKGYRIQVIWRTPKYGGHLGHVHIGARKA